MVTAIAGTLRGRLRRFDAEPELRLQRSPHSVTVPVVRSIAMKRRRDNCKTKKESDPEAKKESDSEVRGV